jgi:hypothetical protein
VTAGVLPPGLFQWPFLALASIICLVVMGSLCHAEQLGRGAQGGF